MTSAESAVLLDKLYQQQNDLVQRIAGLTDYILKEQVQEEFVMLEEKIAKIREQVETRSLHEKLVEICKEHVAYYKTQFILEKNMVTAIEKTNNIDLTLLLNKHRLRIPKGLNNRRDLCIMANALKKVVVVKDLEGIIIDQIGNWEKNDSLVDLPVLILYVFFFSKIHTYEVAINNANYAIQ